MEENNKNIPMRTVKKFPHLFRGYHGANVKKLAQYIAKRKEPLQKPQKIVPSQLNLHYVCNDRWGEAEPFQSP